MLERGFPAGHLRASAIIERPSASRSTLAATAVLATALLAMGGYLAVNESGSLDQSNAPIVLKQIEESKRSREEAQRRAEAASREAASMARKALELELQLSSQEAGRSLISFSVVIC